MFVQTVGSCIDIATAQYRSYGAGYTPQNCNTCLCLLPYSTIATAHPHSYLKLRCTTTCAQPCVAQAVPRKPPVAAMPGKRHLSEMGVDELNVCLQETKRRAALIETEMQRRACAHTFERRHVIGPRDNNEYEFICSKCGVVN